MADKIEEEKPEQVKATCPECGHSFWHNLKDNINAAGEALGNALGEGWFGG
jgi:hypothetical protein